VVAVELERSYVAGFLLQVQWLLVLVELVP
jgi:hypothetical protein